jgi:antirestriction protein ArdC
MFNPYTSNEWFTSNNAIKMTGNKKPIPYEEFKNSTRIIYYNMIPDGVDKHGEEKFRPMLKTYSVWNREQIPDLPQIERTSEFDPKSTIDEMLVNLELKGGIHTGGDVACFVPSQDAVMLPTDEAFDTPDDAVSVKAHEGCHATGADHRLKRKLSKKDATAYAYEELIAELGSAMVCASLGIPLDKLRHTDYIGVWLKRLKDDTSYIFRAAADASKAMKYLTKEAA